MPRTMRRMIGLFAGYALAVVVASVACCGLMAAWAFFFQPNSIGLAPSVIVSGIFITASTAWPGYLVTVWLLLSKRMANIPWRTALSGALTAAQALLLLSYFVGSIENQILWAPAIVGGFLGAYIFSLVAEPLFGMRLDGPSPSPSPSES